MPQVSGQQWSCHSCGDCCRTLVGDLTDEERAGLDAHPWEEKLGAKPYVLVGRRAALNKRADGSCVFLDDTNRCMIHAQLGEQAKPIACRIFPFSVRRVENAWQASFRFDCPSATASKGKPISQYGSWLTDLAQQLSQDSQVIKPETLERGLIATQEELAIITSRLSRWVKEKKLPVHHRMIAISRVASMLYDAKLASVRGMKLGELLDIFWQSAIHEMEPPLLEPTKRQHAMLRQLAFVHAEFVTLQELRAGFISQMKKRWQQLGAARRFFSGKSTVPALQGFSGQTTFDVVGAVSPASQTEEIDELIERYLLSRTTSRSIFGSGYYSWPLAAGMAALTASVSTIGWLARLHCAQNGRAQLQLEDVSQAVVVVDRAVTRLPAVGSTAERARIRYLSVEDGLARLLHRYAIGEETT